ncbi:hypothetical protein Z043_113692 [Scleropages formosus]|uniref:LIM zinc-binding domain-containing protein n=1 Tax=Scleropages formosus TaxID=113540 RepID=A0A0P7X040_SCLFO|nr:hypothetical protein Z043_113692 [Scleropages formosus]
MSSYYARQYAPKTDATSSRTIEESKTKTVLMKDRSWIKLLAEEEADGDYSKTTEPKSFPKLSPISSSTTRASFTSSSNTDDGPVRRTTSYSVSTEPRVIVDKDMCTYCRKPLSPDPKVILDDMKIKCHASCFKCEVCNKPLGHLKAGDSMWVYQRMVHCESCFDITRGTITQP